LTTGATTIYDDNNDGNPTLHIGSSAAESLQITTTYESGGKLIESVSFTTKTEDSDANDGEMLFYIDEALEFSINDSGIVIADAAYIGSASDTAAIQIEADGDIVFTDDIAVNGDDITSDGALTVTSPGITLDADGTANQDIAFLLNDNSTTWKVTLDGSEGTVIIGDGDAFDHILKFDASTADGTITWDEDPGHWDFAADIKTSEDITVGDDKYIGSTTDPLAIQIEGDGDIVLTDDLAVNGDDISSDGALTVTSPGITLDADGTADQDIIFKLDDDGTDWAVTIDGSEGTVIIGDGDAFDHILKFDATPNDGTITWDTDPGAFVFNDDIDVSEQNITNVGDISVDSVSVDGATLVVGAADEETHVRADGLPDSDDTYSCGMVVYLTAGNAVKQWDLVAMQTDGKVDMANASMNTVIGFAVEETNDGWPAAEDETIGVCLLGSGGVIRNDGWASFTAGQLVYVVDAGGTDGLFDVSGNIDLEDGDHWTLVGVMQEEDIIIFPAPAFVTDDGS